MEADRVKIIETALWVSIIAITFSAAAITWSISRMKTMEKQVEHLEQSYDLMSVRYANQTAWLQAHGIEVPE